MSDVGPSIKEWPPVDLIADLSLDATAEPEIELDQKVRSGMSSPYLCRSFLVLRQGHRLELPPGTEVLEIAPSGASAWVQTVRIRTRQKNGITKDYFKKVRCTFDSRDII